jgi:hypothetical protein
MRLTDNPGQVHLNIPGLYEHWHYNTPQLQPTDIGLGTTNSGGYASPSNPSQAPTDWSSWKVHYDFNSGGDAANNGNVRSQTVTAQGNSYTQTYTYHS